MRKVKQPVVVHGTYINGEFIVNSFALPGEKSCIVYRQLSVEKRANTDIGVQGLKYLCTTEEVQDDIVVKKQRALWRENESWFVEKIIDDEIP